MDVLKFTVLDDTTHVIGAGEYTVCGLAIPYGNGYVTDEPKKLCGDCKSRIKDTDEFGVARSVQEEAAPETLAPEVPESKPEPKATKEAPKTSTTSKAKSGTKA